MKRGDILEKNEFLTGLKELFKKYGITVVYPASKFTGERSLATCIVICKTEPKEMRKEISTYFRGDIDIEEEFCPLVLFAKKSSREELQPIYKSGVFYAY